MVKVGDVLVQKGYITQQQLDAALSVQGEHQIGQVLINWNFITQEQLLEALDIQTPPPPPPPPVQPQFPQYPQQPVMPQMPPQQPPQGGPDLTMDNLQTSKFKIDLKTLIYIGSLLFTAVTGYYTFMGELDERFGALEQGDNQMVVDMDKRLTALEVDMDKRLTELENTFTPIGDGVYSVDPNSTWPPSRGEYKMKDEMSRNKIMVLEGEIEELKDEIKDLEQELKDK